LIVAVDPPRDENPLEIEIDVAGAEASETPETPSASDQPVRKKRRRSTPSRSAAADAAEAPDVTPTESTGDTAAPKPLPYWGEPSSATSSRSEHASESLYEVEIDVRNSAVQSDGAQAAIGDLAASVFKLIGDNLRRMTEEQADQVTQMLRDIDVKDYLDPDFWNGLGMVLQYQIDEQVAFFQRRMRGEYTTDPYGMDPEIITVVRPFFEFMYRTWWRVTATGLENVPAEGRGLLVSNHSGVLPWDGAMIATAVACEHPVQNERIVRSLHLHWFSTLPFVAPALAAVGQVPGVPENAVRLLEEDELVCVFPEGLKGVGKLYKDRYRLARFGRGGFVQAALRAQAPIVPVAVIGAEEIYPMLGNAESIAKALGMPYFPLTPFFPWLGLLGTIPLPTRWNITFCDPLPTDEYGPEAADDPLTVLMFTEQVRSTIQSTIDTGLADRTSVF
jgi:1-acyl-sn-glycerol-3-phosphate acyltransferase